VLKKIEHLRIIDNLFLFSTPRSTLLFFLKKRKKERKKENQRAGSQIKKKMKEKVKEMENSFLSFFYSLMPTGLNLQWRKPILWRRIKEKGFCF